MLRGGKNRGRAYFYGRSKSSLRRQRGRRRNRRTLFLFRRELGRYLRKIKDKQIRIHICSDNMYINATVEVLLSREFSLKVEQRIAKRTIDIVCSLILLIIRLSQPIYLYIPM